MKSLLKQSLSIFIISLLFVSCTPNHPLPAQKANFNRDSLIIYRVPAWFDIRDTLNTKYFGIKVNPSGNYENLLSGIDSKRLEYKRLLEDSTNNKDSIINSASQYLENALVNMLIPHWYGTPWDFNGYTNTPNKGVVACGYFVSTTLKHVGFNINRYKFAQQYGKVSGESLEKPMRYIICNNNDDYNHPGKKIKAALKEEGLYFVGLSCHVGYVLYRKNKLFFIHSSYLQPLKVVIEDALSSDAFISNEYWFSAITTNKKLVEKWVLGERIVI